MKKYLVVLSMFLGGCVSFDPVEYDRFVTIATTAELGKRVCSSPLDMPQITNHLVVMSSLAVNNAKYRKKMNEEQIATEILNMSIELQSKYGVTENIAFVASKSYCEAKMDNIFSAASIAARSTGSRR